MNSCFIFFLDAPRLLQPGVGLGSPGGLRNPSAGASQLGNLSSLFCFLVYDRKTNRLTCPFHCFTEYYFNQASSKGMFQKLIVYVFWHFTLIMLNRFVERYRWSSSHSFPKRDAAFFSRFIHGSSPQFSCIGRTTPAYQCCRRRCWIALFTLCCCRCRRIFQLRSCGCCCRWPVISTVGRIPDGRAVIERRHRWWVVCPIASFTFPKFYKKYWFRKLLVHYFHVCFSLFRDIFQFLRLLSLISLGIRLYFRYC